MSWKDKDWTLRLIAVIAILLVIIWALMDRNQQLEQENRQLTARQLIIDRAIIENQKCIIDALPQPMSYVEVYDE